jgi:hypothetical protein
VLIKQSNVDYATAWGNVTGGLSYLGSWNASTNTPTLTSSVGTNGNYYIVSVAGSTNLNGITDWLIGDWAIFNGSVWQKIDQTNTVTSVNGQIGAVSLAYADLAGAIPTWNQNTTGTAANVTGVVAIVNGGSGQTSAQTAMNAFAGSVTSGSYLRGDGTNVLMSTIQVADVPTLNQNTTGTAANVTGVVAVLNGGTGATTAADARTNLSAAHNLITISAGTGLSGGGDLTANRTLSIDSTVVTLTGVQTLTNKTINGSDNTLTNIANASLSNSAITINGSSVSLGASITVTSTASNALTIGTGLSGTSYNGSAAVTIAIDSTVVTLTGTQTLTNKTIDSAIINTPTIATPTLTGGTINNTAIGGTTPAAGAFTSVAMTSGTIVNAPVNGTDIVNKQYADAIASGIHFHEAVDLATTAALPANTYNNGTSGVGATLTANANGALSVDSTLTVATNRILVKNEVTQANNGVYVVTQVGSAGTPYILTRATDFDTAGSGVNQIDEGDFFLVTSGVANLNTAWVQQTTPPIVVGTTALVFQQFAAPLVYSAGTGLNESPTYTFNIANTAVTSGSYGLAASVPTIAVNAQGQITSASNTAIAIAATQVTSGTLAIAQGGTNSSATATAGGAAYGTGTAFAFTAAGTAGQVLTSNGASAPTWAGISGGTF